MKIKKFEFNMFPVNTYLIWDEQKEAILIDPGCASVTEQTQLKEYIESKELTLKHLLNTHLHLDHILGNPFVYNTFGLKPEAHKADEFWLENAPKQSRMFGFELPENQVPIGTYLSEGSIIETAGIKLEAIHVPGHSPGSLVFYCAADHCLFGGDVLFQGSIGRADLEGGNFDELREGICKKLFVLPPETMVFPGHGGKTTIGAEKSDNPFFRG